MINDINIYVISHSEEEITKILDDDIYTPLFVGRNGKDNLGFCSDDTGDNISYKNKDYCELTGLYWMWKNDSSKIIGLCHYRRYFKNNENNLLNKEDINRIFDENNYDIIVPEKTGLVKGSLQENYKNENLGKCLPIVESFITKNYPEYKNSYKNIVYGNSFSSYNMVITKKVILNEYCNWLFPILKELEKNEHINNAARIYGLISEVIFNVWLDYNKLNIIELPLKYKGLALNFRMFLINSSILRKLYKYSYNHLFKKFKNNNFDNFIIKIFYKWMK